MKTAEKKDASGRMVLVGTYKGDQLTRWRGWYNYPISDKDNATDWLVCLARNICLGL